MVRSAFGDEIEIGPCAIAAGLRERREREDEIEGERERERERGREGERWGGESGTV